MEDLWHNACFWSNEDRTMAGLFVVRRGVLTLVLVGFSLLAGAAQQGTVQLEIIGLETLEGQLIVRVYSREDAWLSEDFVLEKKVALANWPQDKPMVFTLELPQGEYALSVFHDQDGNGRMKRYPMGMPAEPVVMSNNALGNFGPPKFKDARFELGDEVVVQRLDIS